MIKCSFRDSQKKRETWAGDVLVLPMFEDESLDMTGVVGDPSLYRGVLAHIEACRFRGKSGEHMVLSPPDGVTAFHVILVLGFGKKDSLDVEAVEKAARCCAKQAQALGARSLLAVFMDGVFSADQLVTWASGVSLMTYRFDSYIASKDESDRRELETLTIESAHASACADRWEKEKNVLDGVALTRDLVNEPPNILTPPAFAERLRALEALGVEVSLHDNVSLEKEGMRAMLGVAQGSVYPPSMVVMRWRGSTGKDQTRPVTFIGKGVTFDTGGVSLKPSAGMEEMKSDMGGAGVVAGLLHALAARKASVHAVGIVGLVENAVSGTAQRPSDIVISRAGKSIEVLNTDAEGRLVLADLLSYAQDHITPRMIVDLATLTGAMVIALGYEYAGFFSNDDTLANQLTDVGRHINEKVWRMPLHKAYDKMLDSKVADMQNVTNQRSAGSITAAQFLQRFVHKDMAWAHIDIAGVTYHKKPSFLSPYGASGFGVRLLDRLVSQHYES